MYKNLYKNLKEITFLSEKSYGTYGMVTYKHFKFEFENSRCNP